MATLIQVTCKRCGISFYRDAGHVKENQKLGHNFYCSLLCQFSARVSRKILVCENGACGKQFERTLKHVLIHNYCSQSCAAIVNNQKFPKRGPGFRICEYKKCKKRFQGWRQYCSRLCMRMGRRRYLPEELLEILKFAAHKLERTPAKRELPDVKGCIVKAFGTWNKAIIAAGLEPNRSHDHRMYSRTKTKAKDGHVCDSISEAIIDNWLTQQHIPHDKNVAYPDTHHTVDWRLESGTFVEYFGLAKDSPRYDREIVIKKELCRRHGIRLVEVYPHDLYPVTKLHDKFMLQLKTHSMLF